MPRRVGGDVAGIVYHAMNRAIAGLTLFKDQGDYGAFEGILQEAWQREPIRILSYTVMPNHWHMVLLPTRGGQMASFLRWLSVTHAKRWHAYRGTAGSGHLYQGPFKSFPVATDEYFLTACRYVERNALAAGLVRKAQDWRWSSLWRRLRGDADAKAILSPWPEEPTENWLEWVNTPLTDRELEAMQASIRRGRPFGSLQWQEEMAAKLGCEHTLRSRGRPMKTCGR